MARTRKQSYAPLLEKYGLDESAVWDCHGNPTLYHWACEQIAEKINVEFELPEVVYTDNDSTIVLRLTAKLFDAEGKGRIEWTFGEVNPRNNKTSYPWAMAEKRAKDRLILKLAGLHGRLYAQSEMDGSGDGSILDGGEPVFRDAQDFSTRCKAAFVELSELVERDTAIDFVNGLLEKYDAKQFVEVQEQHRLEVAALLRNEYTARKKAAEKRDAR
jgi:hypothetical protein